MVSEVDIVRQQMACGDPALVRMEVVGGVRDEICTIKDSHHTAEAEVVREHVFLGRGRGRHDDGNHSCTRALVLEELHTTGPRVHPVEAGVLGGGPRCEQA